MTKIDYVEGLIREKDIDVTKLGVITNIFIKVLGFDKALEVFEEYGGRELPIKSLYSELSIHLSQKECETLYNHFYPRIRIKVPNTKVMKKQIRNKIILEKLSLGISANSLSIDYGVSEGLISKIKKGER